MPLSPYMRALREKVGTARLLLPAVTALLHDDANRLLLVRQRDSLVWSTPGGMIEPDERPADAVVRETWEETGLLVVPRRISAVLGGPEFVVSYPNEDEVQYVSIVFECELVRGQLRPDGVETMEVAYWSLEEAAMLPLPPWLEQVLTKFYTHSEGTAFEAARWEPL